MTESAKPPPTVRVVGHPAEAPEAFVPMNLTARSRAVLDRQRNGPTSEERERWGRDAACREAKRREALASDIARHAVLSGEHRDDPILSVLLDAHGPCLVESSDGREYGVCHGCPTYWTDAPSGEPYEEHHEWPCPTWTTIAEQTA